MNTLAETLSLWERQRLEYQCLNPNRIWFQRHETNSNIIAEVCLVNNLYRFRIFDGKSTEHVAQGNGNTLPEAKKQVFEFFGKH